MTFPSRRDQDLKSYLAEYAERLSRALGGIDVAALAKAETILREATLAGRRIYSCGNGGSAAISDHLACDHQKGVATNTALRPRVQSLTANTPILTAISNDISYDAVFSHQIEGVAEAGDVLIAISSSGNSENIVRALTAAAAKKMRTIALVGFDGGRARALAEVAIHVNEQNYGIVEDAHQSIMHILAQHLRLGALDANRDPAATKF